MEDPRITLERLTQRKGKLAHKIDAVGELALCDHFFVLDELRTQIRILRMNAPPVLNFPGRKTDDVRYGSHEELISTRNDFLSCFTMQSYLTRELVENGEFRQYEVSDVGFWDLDVTTDTGFSWHNDCNWNSLLRPDNRSYHGWLVYSCTEDCNTTLAISKESRFNECNTNVMLGICGIDDDSCIRPDVIVPLEKDLLVLFPIGSVHRTYRFKAPQAMAGHRVCASFILHHKEDGLNETKIESMSDEELCRLFYRYPVEKAFETGHYMVTLLEKHPRIAPLLRRISLQPPIKGCSSR